MNFGVSRPKLKPWDKPSEVTLNFTDVLGLPSWDVSQDMEIWGQSEGAMVVYIFPLGSWLELLSLPTTFYSYSAEVLRRRRNPLKPTGLPVSIASHYVDLFLFFLLPVWQIQYLAWPP